MIRFIAFLWLIAHAGLTAYAVWFLVGEPTDFSIAQQIIVSVAVACYWLSLVWATALICVPARLRAPMSDTQFHERMATYRGERRSAI